MIDEINQAIESYRKLDLLGKRVFQQTTGLAAGHGGPRRGNRKKKGAPTKRTGLRASRRKADTTIDVAGSAPE